MSWHCPECNITYHDRGTGVCSCYIIRGYKVHLIWEDDEMAIKIKYTGNLERFRGQKTGKLLYAELAIVKELSDEFKSEIGEPIPRGSAILCVYMGERNYPFIELKNYGSATLSKLQKSIGQIFEIDCPADAKPINLDFGTNV